MTTSQEMFTVRNAFSRITDRHWNHIDCFLERFNRAIKGTGYKVEKTEEGCFHVSSSWGTSSCYIEEMLHPNGFLEGDEAVRQLLKGLKTFKDSLKDRPAIAGA